MQCMAVNGVRRKRCREAVVVKMKTENYKTAVRLQQGKRETRGTQNKRQEMHVQQIENASKRLARQNKTEQHVLSE